MVWSGSLLVLIDRAVLRNMPTEEMFKLRRNRRRAAQLRFTLGCLTRWLEGGAARDGLILEALNLPLPIHRPGGSVASNLRRCERIAREDGQYGKALKSLASSGVAEFGPQTTQILREKHPQGWPVTLQNLFPDGLEVKSEDIITQLRVGRSTSFSSAPTIGLPSQLSWRTSQPWSTCSSRVEPCRRSPLSSRAHLWCPC